MLPKLTVLSSGKKWVLLLTVLALLVVSTLVFIATEQYFYAERISVAEDIANRKARQIDLQLNQNMFATYALAAMIKNEHGNISGFEGLAKEFIAYQKGIASLQLAPKGIIRHIVPLQGNEKALGLNLLSDENKNMEAKRSLQTRKLTLAGPFHLVQGGDAMIGRLPVFLNDDASSFWGFTSALVKMDDFLESVKLEELNQDGYSYALWRTNPDTGERHVIAKSATVLSENPITAYLDVPNGRWNLSVTPQNGWFDLTRIVIDGIAILLITTLGGGTFYRHLVGQQATESSEARFKKLYIASPVMMHSFSADRKIISVSNTWLQKMGYTLTEVLGHEQGEFMTPQSREASAGIYRKENFQAGEFPETSCQLLTRSGQVIDVQLSASAEFDSEGRIFQVLVVMQDITEHKRMDRMKDEFVSIVSHELRTPLTAISGSLGLIDGGVLGVLPEKAAEMAHVAYKNSQRLAVLINDLLDMEKLLAGKMDFNIQLHRLKPLLEESIESMSAYGRDRGIKLALSESIPDIELMVDSQRLLQVMSNLLSNSIKYSDDDGIVQIGVVPQEKSVRVSVSDQGPGIPTEFRSRIFQKFTQADSSDTRKKGGTGLGLVICKEMIEKMGGTLSFESEVSQGATFYFDLPISSSGQK